MSRRHQSRPSQLMKISIITACYNREATIEKCVASLATQTHPDIEWIVVDGGSSDRTLEVLGRAARLPDVLISERDDGIYDALNKGLSKASGEVVGFLHSDDFYPNDDVLTSVAERFEDSSVDAVYGNLEYVYAHQPQRVLRSWKSEAYARDRFATGWMPPHPTFYMRRRHYEELGCFDPSYEIAADYESMLRYLWTHQLHALHMPKVLMRMRAGGVSNRSLGNMLRKSGEDLRAMKVHGVSRFALIRKNLSKLPQFFRR